MDIYECKILLVDDNKELVNFCLLYTSQDSCLVEKYVCFSKSEQLQGLWGTL